MQTDLTTANLDLKSKGLTLEIQPLGGGWYVIFNIAKSRYLKVANVKKIPSPAFNTKHIKYAYSCSSIAHAMATIQDCIKRNL